MEYLRVCEGNNAGGKPDEGFLIPYEAHPLDYVKDANKAHYLSTFIYNDEHYKIYKAKNSIAGIVDVTTDKIYFDFDCKDDLGKSQKDAIEMCARLQQHGIPPEKIQIAFSGYKGFSVEVITDKRYTPRQVQAIAIKMAEGLPTFDTSMYNAARVFRIYGTKHFQTGLYKFPLTVNQLSELSPAVIKELAKDIENADYNPYNSRDAVKVPNSIDELKHAETKDRVTTTAIELPEDLDFTTKTKGFSNCKFAILNGFFPPGRRDESMMALAATCRALGYPKEITYNMCKGAARLQAQRYDSEPFSKKEIWNNVVGQVYGDHWKGAQYSCKTQPWLKEICDSLGTHKCNHSADSSIIAADEVFSMFKTYAENYEKNALSTGITSLDTKVKFLVGTSNGILAPPGVGKTSFCLSMLNHNSRQDINSVFFSYDMFHSMVYLRLVQKHFGLQQETIFKLLKDNSPKVQEIKEAIKAEYKNVNFCFKSGQTVEDINNTILEAEEKTGKKTKLVIVDYNELVSSAYSDSTQASAQVAQQLRQVANDREVCVVTLLQPSKLYSNPSEEASTYQAAKGSGAIAQSLTMMLGLSRPGFSPQKPEEDKYMAISALKNRVGPLFSLNLSWNGLRGDIGELSEEDKIELSSIKARKALEKGSDTSWN